CLPHFRAALDLPLDKKLLRKLCSLQIDRLAILSRELTGYIDKHGHNHNGEITKGEQDAWIKAIALVSGNHCPV
ncbi:MAG: hypothetical protein GYA42_07240, partial [Syntrophomonadaceae bacterium]|nr:hypothetical protein [Syntrophomonadaceae bacterium]